jgi:gliding motility-associated-like protein
MKNRRSLSWAALLAATFVVASSLSSSAYVRIDRITLSATATLGGGGGAGAGSVSLSVPLLLPFQAFFGKDIVIPVEIQGTAGALAEVSGAAGASGSSGVAMLYQLQDSVGNPIGPQISVPIVFQNDPNNPSRMDGIATIPVQNLQSVRQNGRVAYFFQVRRNNQVVSYNNAGVPFQMQFINMMSFPVNDSGSMVVVPDPSLTDGKTSVFLPPGSLSNPGILVVRQENILGLPAGPRGLQPIVAYDFELQGATLQGEAEVTLTYPARPDGSIIGFNGDPENLSPFWLDGMNWQVLGPRKFDGRMHTVSARTTHFSKYGLFIAGAGGAAELRPRQRILTPNGDGINDTALFSAVTTTDDVKIFDMRGRKMRTMHGPNPAWDGRDDEGRIVESGLYLYQYTSQGELVSGVILIAK